MLSASIGTHGAGGCANQRACCRRTSQSRPPAVVSPAPAKPLEYSPGVAELSPAERRAAFMAATTEPKTEATKETEKETDTEAADSTTEKEGNTEEAAQAERAADNHQRYRIRRGNPDG